VAATANPAGHHLLVTPARILFLIILVGTTIEVLAERPPS